MLTRHPFAARVVRALVRSLFTLAMFAVAWVAGIALADYGIAALCTLAAIVLVAGTALGVALDSRFAEDVDA